MTPTELPCPSDDLIAFAITEAFGERCPTTDADCYTCQAWSQYDKLRAAATPSAEGAQAALAQLDSADARSALAAKVQSIFADKLSIDALNMEVDGTGPASYAVADLLLSAGLLPDASPGNGAEKMDSLMDSQYLAGAKAGWNAAHTDDPDASYQRIVDGRKDHLKGLRAFNEALHSTSAAGEGREEIVLVAHEIRCARDAYLDNFGSQGNADRKAKLMQVMFDDAGTIIAALDELASIDKIAAGETTSSDGQRENQPEKRTGPHRASGETNSGSTGDSELTRSAACPSEAIPADVLAMKEACKRAVRSAPSLDENGYIAEKSTILAAIDKLPPEGKADASPPDWKQDQAETTRIKPPATAEGGRDEPVAWRWQERNWGKYWIYNPEQEWLAEQNNIVKQPLYTHPSSPPDVEAIARIIDPEAFEKWDDAQGSWRKDEAKVACWPAEEKADAIAALIAGGR